MKKSGFTLSEVLLTLGIIGVVAAMTVPSLMNSTEDKKLAAAAKKAYNTLQNAISQKQALTELTPEDTNGASFIDFLAGKTTDGVQVIKYNEYKNKMVQLPDGILMAAAQGSGTTCGSEDNTAVGEGQYCLVTVDINGEAGPTFSVLDAGTYNKTSGGAATSQFGTKPVSSSYQRTNRDIIHFRVDRLNVIPDPQSATAQRYIQGIKN